MYVDLEVRSNFSFLQGASPPERLVRRAAELGYDALAITDVGGLYGIVRAMEASEQAGLRLIVGCELGRVLLHVENHAGYTNLCRILTKAHEDDRDLEPSARTGVLDFDHLCGNAEGLWCIALPNGHDHEIARLKDAFGARLSLGVRRLMDGEDAKNLRTQTVLAAKFSVPLVATGGVRFAKPEE
jgi:error-prone DNA polymerase